MKTSKKVAIIALVMGLGIFGYSQYASASQIEVAITNSQLLKETADSRTYNLQLEFDNPSLLMLTAGETEFTVAADGQRIGDGLLEPFILSAMDKTTVQGTYMVDAETESDEAQKVRISGITKYDMLFASLDIPFVYYPTEDQAREFIR